MISQFLIIVNELVRRRRKKTFLTWFRVNFSAKTIISSRCRVMPEFRILNFHESRNFLKKCWTRCRVTLIHAQLFLDRLKVGKRNKSEGKRWVDSRHNILILESHEASASVNVVCFSRKNFLLCFFNDLGELIPAKKKRCGGCGKWKKEERLKIVNLLEHYIRWASWGESTEWTAAGNNRSFQYSTILINT